MSSKIAQKDRKPSFIGTKSKRHRRKDVLAVACVSDDLICKLCSLFLVNSALLLPPALREFAVSLEVASREDAKAVCIRLFQLLRSLLLSLPETLRLVQHVASMLEWARSSGALDRRIDPLASRPVYAPPTDTDSPAARAERGEALNKLLDVEELLRWDSNQKWDDAERTEHNADVISSSSSLSSSSSSFSSSSSQSSALSIADTNDDDSDHRRFQRMVNDSRYQPYLEALHEGNPSAIITRRMIEAGIKVDDVQCFFRGATARHEALHCEAEGRSERQRRRDAEERRLTQAGKLKAQRAEEERDYVAALERARAEDRRLAAAERREELGDGGAEEAASGEITSRRGGGGGGWRGSQSREEGPRAQAVVAARARELKERASPRPAWWRHREGRYLLATLKPKEVVPDDSPPAVARSAKPTALLAPAFSHQDGNDAAATAAAGGAGGREGALIATPPPSELRSRSFSPGWRMGTAPGVDAFVNHPPAPRFCCVRYGVDLAEMEETATATGRGGGGGGIEVPLAVQHFNMAVLLTTPPTVAVPASSGQDANEPSPFEPTAEMCDRACEHYRTAIELIEAETETEAHVEQAQAIFLDASKSSLLMAACYNLALLLSEAASRQALRRGERGPPMSRSTERLYQRAAELGVAAASDRRRLAKGGAEAAARGERRIGRGGGGGGAAAVTTTTAIVDGNNKVSSAGRAVDLPLEEWLRPAGGALACAALNNLGNLLVQADHTQSVSSGEEHQHPGDETLDDAKTARSNAGGFEGFGNGEAKNKPSPFASPTPAVAATLLQRAAECYRAALSIEGHEDDTRARFNLTLLKHRAFAAGAGVAPSSAHAHDAEVVASLSDGYEAVLSVWPQNRPANCYLGLLRQHYHTEAGTVFDDDDDDDDGVVRHGEHKLTGEGRSDAGANDTAAFTVARFHYERVLSLQEPGRARSVHADWPPPRFASETPEGVQVIAYQATKDAVAVAKCARTTGDGDWPSSMVRPLDSSTGTQRIWPSVSIPANSRTSLAVTMVAPTVSTPLKAATGEEEAAASALPPIRQSMWPSSGNSGHFSCATIPYPDRRAQEAAMCSEMAAALRTEVLARSNLAALDVEEYVRRPDIDDSDEENRAGDDDGAGTIDRLGRARRHLEGALAAVHSSTPSVEEALRLPMLSDCYFNLAVAVQAHTEAKMRGVDDAAVDRARRNRRVNRRQVQRQRRRGEEREANGNKKGMASSGAGKAAEQERDGGQEGGGGCKGSEWATMSAEELFRRALSVAPAAQALEVNAPDAHVGVAQALLANCEPLAKRFFSANGAALTDAEEEALWPRLVESDTLAEEHLRLALQPQRTHTQPAPGDLGARPMPLPHRQRAAPVEAPWCRRFRLLVRARRRRERKDMEIQQQQQQQQQQQHVDEVALEAAISSSSASNRTAGTSDGTYVPSRVKKQVGRRLHSWKTVAYAELAWLRATKTAIPQGLLVVREAKRALKPWEKKKLATRKKS